MDRFTAFCTVSSSQNTLSSVTSYLLRTFVLTTLKDPWNRLEPTRPPWAAPVPHNTDTDLPPTPLDRCNSPCTAITLFIPITTTSSYVRNRNSCIPNGTSAQQNKKCQTHSSPVPAATCPEPVLASCNAYFTSMTSKNAHNTLLCTLQRSGTTTNSKFGSEALR